MKGMFFMANIFDKRHIVSKNFNFLRILQSETLNKKSVEEIRAVLNLARSSADRSKQDLVVANVITEKLDINPNFATFIGISISYSEIEISAVGMDGKVIPWEEILSRTKYNHEGFDGKIKFNYSSLELINISTFINELIRTMQSIFSVRAICFAFDCVDIKNGTFSLAEYFKENCTYSFDDFCAVCFGEISKDIVLFLERNAMCQLVSGEFPMLKRDYNSLFLDLEQNGCFVAILFYNTIYCGYNMQTLNLSGVLSDTEKEALASGDVSDAELLTICTKILKALIIPLTPERIYICGKIVHQNAKLSSLLSFQKAEFLDLCSAKNYNPSIKLVPNSMSRGAAIMAMYRYYGWDYTCL